MKTYTIYIHGCDDSTIFDIELSDQEAETVRRISEKSIQTSTYSCMPKLQIGEGPNKYPHTHT